MICKISINIDFDKSVPNFLRVSSQSIAAPGTVTHNPLLTPKDFIFSPIPIPLLFNSSRENLAEVAPLPFKN